MKKFKHALKLSLVLAPIVLPCQFAAAVVTEPDIVVYGSIMLDGVAVGADRTDVRVEARRTVDGPAVTTYQMGDNPAFGDFYSLLISIESVTPIGNSNSVQVGEALYITLLDGSGQRAQQSYQVTDRGVIERLDFGNTVMDGDHDGLPDAWELMHFGNLGQGTNSLAANGQTVWQNYLAGSDPTDPNAGFRLFMAASNNVKQVSFVAVRAEGPGYEGLVRLYTLEANSNLGAPAWSNVPGFADLAGDNQTIAYQTTGAESAEFFRGLIKLQQGAIGGTNDVDADGLPDNWETLYFGNLNTTPATVNQNQQTAWQNFGAGNNPNTASSIFKLHIVRTNNQTQISFVALPAAGVGYEGQNRFYSLETSSDPASGIWIGVSNLIGLLATNQTIEFVAPNPGAAFYRAQVWLQNQ